MMIDKLESENSGLNGEIEKLNTELEFAKGQWKTHYKGIKHLSNKNLEMF